MSEYEYAQKGSDRAAQGAVEELDRELERFDVTLERLAKLLEPVMSLYATADARLGEPRSEPATQLRGRTERLRTQLGRLDGIMSQVDL